MILIQDKGFKAAGWSEHPAEDIEALLTQMGQALKGEGIVKPRSYEVMEVVVKRRVVVEREVEQVVNVNVKEEQAS